MKIRGTGNGKTQATILTLLSTLAFTGCQKVINVNLNDAAPRIVIEGLITDRRGPYTVTISKTADYFNASALQTVSGATVLITDNFDNLDTLKELKPGVYFTSRVRGVADRSYTLKVLSEDQQYEGSCTLPGRVNIDSLKLVKSDISRFDFDGNRNTLHLEIHCFFKDPEEKNYYRVKVFKNDSIDTENYRLYDDQYTNGLYTELRVARATRGDTYRIELWAIDKQTYGFYRTLGELLDVNPVFGSTQANPNNNLSNGALGYFGAGAVSSKTIIITDDLINAVP